MRAQMSRFVAIHSDSSDAFYYHRPKVPVAVNQHSEQTGLAIQIADTGTLSRISLNTKTLTLVHSPESSRSRISARRLHYERDDAVSRRTRLTHHHLQSHS